jgi:hypothetical protein
MTFDIEEMTCDGLQHHWDSPILDPSPYGLFFFVTSNLEFVELDSFSDPVFDEVVAMLASLETEFPAIARDNGPIACTLASTIDPSPNGATFVPLGESRCPVCGARAAASIRTKRTVTAPVLPAPHSQWNVLSSEQRIARLRTAASVCWHVN